MSRNVVIPRPLRRGDCIGLFSPAGPVRDESRVAAGINLLHDLGFRTRQIQGSGSKHDYLAADDQARVEELHTLWADDEIQALMAVRGGYGCLRLIDRLDFTLIRSRPKLLIGFSDVTVLLNAISQQTGLVTVHGPVLTTLPGCDQASLEALTTLVGGGLHEYRFSRQGEVLRPGKANGVLRGGNLATLVHLLATPWELVWDGALLFLEDTGEPMYKIDRMLTQLACSGRLANLAGIILGTFDSGEENNHSLLQEQVWQRVLELTASSSYPVIGGFPAGHRELNHPLPIGADATLDTGAGRLLFSSQHEL